MSSDKKYDLLKAYIIQNVKYICYDSVSSIKAKKTRKEVHEMYEEIMDYVSVNENLNIIEYFDYKLYAGANETNQLN